MTGLFRVTLVWCMGGSLLGRYHRNIQMCGHVCWVWLYFHYICISDAFLRYWGEFLIPFWRLLVNPREFRTPGRFGPTWLDVIGSPLFASTWLGADCLLPQRPLGPVLLVVCFMFLWRQVLYLNVCRRRQRQKCVPLHLVLLFLHWKDLNALFPNVLFQNRQF